MVQQALIEREQRLIDLKNVVVPLHDEILDDDIKLAAGAEGVARAGDEVAGLRQAQLQRDGEGHRHGLGGLVVRVVADFREQLAVYVGLFVDLGVLFAAAVDELQQRLRKSGVQMRKRLVQPAHRHGRVLVGGQHPAFNDAHPAHPLPAGIGVGIHIVVVDVGSDAREQLVADLVRCAVENDNVHRHVVLCEEFTDGVHRHAERLILGIAENTGGDQRKGDRFAAVLLRQRKA